MKSRPLFSFLTITVLLLLTAHAVFSNPKVAVLDFTVERGIETSMAIPVTEMVMESLVNSRVFTVLDRAYIGQVLKEKEFQLSGMVSDSEVAAVGQYLGADYVVAGKVQLAAGIYFLVAKLIDVKTGVITAQASEQADGKPIILLELARKAGIKLAGSGSAIVSSHSVTLPPTKLLKVGVVHDNSGFSGRGNPLPLEYAGTFAKDRFPGLVEVNNVYDIRPEAFAKAIDDLSAKGCTVVFYLNQSYDEEAQKAALKYPAIHIVALNHGLPSERASNTYVVAGEWERFNYILGILAGGASKSGKVGFLAIVPAPWQYRLINEFALGVRAANPKAVVHVRYYGWDWSPANGLAQARELVAEGCDVFGPVNFPNVLEWFAAEANRGKAILAISEEQPWSFQPKVTISGPIRNFGLLFEAFLRPLLEGKEIPNDQYGVDMNILSWPGEPAVNPGFVAALSAKRIATPDLGQVGAVDLALQRMDMVKQGSFEIFVGPLKDQRGKIRLAANQYASFDPEFYNRMDWLLDNVKDVKPK
jgi:basic membrane protein A and related proteins